MGQVKFEDLELHETYLVHVYFNEDGNPLTMPQFFIGVFIGTNRENIEIIEGKKKFIRSIKFAKFKDIFDYSGKPGKLEINKSPTEGKKKVIFTTSKIEHDNYGSIVNISNDNQNEFYTTAPYTPEKKKLLELKAQRLASASASASASALVSKTRLGGKKSKKNRKSKKKNSKKRKTMKKKR
jgi:hypothetical protein